MKPRRTWPQRLLIVGNAFVIIAAVVTAGALGYSNKQLSQVTRVGLKSVLRSNDSTPPGAPLNYLLVGADDDTGLSPDDPVTKGRGALDGTFRTDTIMVLRIDPKDATARILSFPRDLWVSIPGLKYKSRINAAVEGSGGALRLIETLKQDFGIPIDHYIQVNFAGFKDLVNAIGGVPIFFPEPVRVRHTTAFYVPEAGCHTLDGDEALAFARVRKDYQVFHDGKWTTDKSGDIGRISRQQYFIQVALKRAIAKGIRDPNVLRRLIYLGIKSVKIDDQLRTDDIIALGNRFRNFNPENLVKWTIPTIDAVHGGAEVLEMIESQAEPVLDVFRGHGTTASGGPTLTQAITPSNVKVQVLNGGQPKGSARTVTTAFDKIGFPTIVPADAPLDFAGTETTVRYGTGKLAQARYAARWIRGPAKLVEDPDVTDSDVVVTIAADWTGTLSTPKADSAVPTPSTTTTTAPVATSTTASSSIPPTTQVGAVPNTFADCP